jgi:hypothetical protein
VANAANLKSVAATEPGEFNAVLQALCIQKNSRIPLETNGRSGEFEGFAVVPFPSEAQTLRDLWNSFDRVSNRLGRLLQVAPDPRSQEKYRRTMDWLRNVRTEFKRQFGDVIDKEPIQPEGAGTIPKVS